MTTGIEKYCYLSELEHSDGTTETSGEDGSETSPTRDEIVAKSRTSPSRGEVIQSLVTGKKYLVTSEKLGSGGYSEIYRGILLGDSGEELKSVAVKVPNNNNLNGEEIFYDLFKNRKKSPDICHITDLVLSDNKRLVVMDLLEGFDLQQILDDPKDHDVDINSFMMDVLRALIFLRENEMIHRDIKASNIFVTKDGGAKLIDFGFSTTVERFSGKGTVMGTPDYFSPETILGIGSYTSYQYQDSWATAICFYELINGKHPSKTAEYQDLIQELWHEQYAPLDLTKNCCPLENYKERIIVNWMLQRDAYIRMTPEEAYQALQPHVRIFDHETLGPIPENLLKRYLNRYGFLKENGPMRYRKDMDHDLMPKNMSAMDRLIALNRSYIWVISYPSKLRVAYPIPERES